MPSPEPVSPAGQRVIECIGHIMANLIRIAFNAACIVVTVVCLCISFGV